MTGVAAEPVGDGDPQEYTCNNNSADKGVASCCHFVGIGPPVSSFLFVLETTSNLEAIGTGNSWMSRLLFIDRFLLWRTQNYGTLEGFWIFDSGLGYFGFLGFGDDFRLDGREVEFNILRTIILAGLLLAFLLVEL